MEQAHTEILYTINIQKHPDFTPKQIRAYGGSFAMELFYLKYALPPPQQTLLTFI